MEIHIPKLTVALSWDFVSIFRVPLELAHWWSVVGILKLIKRRACTLITVRIILIKGSDFIQKTHFLKLLDCRNLDKPAKKSKKPARIPPQTPPPRGQMQKQN